MTEACPVCFVVLPVDELPGHVQCHFVDEDGGGDDEPQLVFSRTADGSGSCEKATSSSNIDLSGEGMDIGDAVLESVQCSVCNQLVSLLELDDHERSHR